MGSLGEGRDPERAGRDQALTTVDADGPANGQIGPPRSAVGVTGDSDLEKARKLIKQIGLELQQDPEFGPNIIEPLKMQGVDSSAITR